MPKATTQRVRRHVRAAGVDEAPKFEAPADAPVVASEKKKIESGGHIRISKKDKRMLKRQNLMNSLFLPGDVQKAPKATSKSTGFNSLSTSFLDALPTAEEIKLMEAEREMKKTQKTGITKADRTRLVKEKEKYNLVLNHPVFRTNPIATIKEHLQNELAIANANEVYQKPQIKQKPKVKKEESAPEVQATAKSSSNNNSKQNYKSKNSFNNAKFSYNK